MSFDQWLMSRLLAAGFYSGRADGVHGRELIAALAKFQLAQGLMVTGTATEETVTALRTVKSRKPGSTLVLYGKAPEPPTEPVWMREARRYMGLREIAGAKSNPVIMSWAKRLGGWVASFYSNDDIPWCGLAMAQWISVTLPREVLPSNPLGALAWQSFGVATSAAVGAIMVFSRKGGGHVGFYVGEDATHYHVLGGNQDNAVNLTRIEKGRLVAVRWPRTSEPPVSGAVQLSPSGAPLSQTEA